MLVFRFCSDFFFKQFYITLRYYCYIIVFKQFHLKGRMLQKSYFGAGVKAIATNFQNFLHKQWPTCTLWLSEQNVTYTVLYFKDLLTYQEFFCPCISSETTFKLCFSGHCRNLQAINHIENICHLVVQRKGTLSSLLPSYFHHLWAMTK